MRRIPVNIHPSASPFVSPAATMINDIEERIKTKMKRIFLVDDDYDHTITFKVGLSMQDLKLMRIIIQQLHYQISSRITTIYC